MTDFHSVLTPGEDGQFVNTVIEIPKGSMHKVEYSMEKKIFMLDRVDPSIFAKPVNYGFIPQTLDGDGDALDTLVITDEPLPMGVTVKAKVVGVLNFMDDGEKDFKIICVPQDDRNSGDSIKSLADIKDAWKAKIEHHFNHYKDLKKPGSTKVEGWGDITEAWTIIKECIERYNKK
ncbi:MAG TPA: inorganic diphosphatase [Patescibacteria group bacterium]|nr:inorganic diphosphatase [Patescibacteria group bacterium]